MSRAPVTSLLHILVGLDILLCFGGILYVYYTPNLSWLQCPENPTPAANATFTSSSTKKSTGTAVMSENTENANNAEERGTIILIWVWPFGNQPKQTSCKLLFNITGCYLTDNRSLYYEAHGVMFHHREIRHNLSKLLRMPRPPRQKWVWMNMESPANSLRLPGPDSQFNLTANYRKDSDVWVPYGWIVETSDNVRPFELPRKDKLLCWIVNNWDDGFLRVKYFNELSEHVKVDTYGGHFGRFLSYQDYFKMISSCKFYLSFENSVHKDYITEKLFNPMIHGTVPVVLGPPRDNYEEFVPADSFIHVDDFKNPQELAEHLKLLDQNQEMYERYFAWRKHYVARRSEFGVEHACRICEHIRQHKGYRVFKNLNKWFWG